MKLSNHYLLFSEAEDGADGSGGDVAAASGDNADGVTDAAPGDDPNLPQRPDFIPEQFWDKETGQPLLEQTFKSIQDSRAKITELSEQVKKSATKEAPESAEDYEFDSSVFKDGDKDPALNLFKSIAHKNGIGQDAFEGLVNDFLEGSKEFMPAELNLEEQIKGLGDNGQKIYDSVIAHGEKLLSDGVLAEDELDEFKIAASTKSGISMLNKIREMHSGAIIPRGDAITEGLPTKAELYEMKGRKNDNGQRLYEVDPAFRAKVDEGFKAVFGDEPAGSSEANIGVR